MFESMKKENESRKAEAAPQIDQKAFNEAYQKWLRAPKESKSPKPPQLKDYLAGAREAPASEEYAAKASEKRAMRVDIGLYQKMLREYYFNPAGKKKPEPADFPLAPPTRGESEGAAEKEGVKGKVAKT